MERRVLLVDDDPDILETLADCLSVSPGLGLVTAQTLDEARQRLHESDSIGLVISDLFLGHDDGRLLLHEAKKIRPGIRRRSREGRLTRVVAEIAVG